MKLMVKLPILLFLLGMIGCKPEAPVPVPPVITFVNAQLNDDKSGAIVTFEFFCGDGDLGLRQNENEGEQKANLFVDYYEKINGLWVLKSPIVTWNRGTSKFDTNDLHLRVPFIENEAFKSLKGEMEVTLLYGLGVNDTFRYELTLVDRALRKSNVLVTHEITVL